MGNTTCPRKVASPSIRGDMWAWILRQDVEEVVGGTIEFLQSNLIYNMLFARVQQERIGLGGLT